ncbi:glycosyltransferase family 2 protein [Pelagibacterium sp.]|uniref:glycosyltransferase family 2 protein n=1 Tax=Pelagibacterium sp. TaxID=1967288 RepID=UPI003A8DD9BF
MLKELAVSIIMPAYNAQATIARAVASVLAQTHVHFELVVIADDEQDYEAVLGRAGIADQRLRFLSSGLIGAGSCPARNVGLDAARFEIAAILDADDAFKPEKLEITVPLAVQYGLVSCALDILTPDGDHLRHVGIGENRLLSPDDYKFTNFSMDSMLVHDRRRADPRFSTTQPAMTDLEYLLKIFAQVPACFHVGIPLHDYVKMPVSLSNGPGVKDRMVASKTMMRRGLAEGNYPFADPTGIVGMGRFLDISLAAEKTYAPRPGANPPDLFEDHIEPLLVRTP